MRTLNLYISRTENDERIIKEIKKSLENLFYKVDVVPVADYPGEMLIWITKGAESKHVSKSFPG